MYIMVEKKKSFFMFLIDITVAKTAMGFRNNYVKS